MAVGSVVLSVGCALADTSACEAHWSVLHAVYPPDFARVRHAWRSSFCSVVVLQKLALFVASVAQKAPPPPAAPGCSLCSWEFKRRHQVPATVYHGAPPSLPDALAL